jgi:transcriptional regulator with PAS, ATPase and Fis domain
LFLDEVADMSLATQVKLLRVLQERVYEPLGALEPVAADVRIVVATNKSLEEEVAAGRFRQDLYYRLNVMPLTLPPLRQRRDDVPLLVRHALNRANAINNTHVPEVTSAALASLMRYDYPGNVRELENILEYAVVLAQGAPITLQHLPQRVSELREPLPDTHWSGHEGQNISGAQEPPPVRRHTGSVGVSLRDQEREQIVQALARHPDSRSNAAAELGIHPTTLWRKIKRYGL